MSHPGSTVEIYNTGNGLCRNQPKVVEFWREGSVLFHLLDGLTLLEDNGLARYCNS